jgi:hypothetical protein
MRKLFVAMVVVGLCSTAWARPKIGILGIEVGADRSGPDAVAAAQLVTEALRTRVSKGIGPHELAPYSEVDLLDVKVANHCEAELPACMSIIGKKLGADVLLYGKLENKATAYRITLRVLDVTKQKLGPAYSENVPAFAKTSERSEWAWKVYNKLFGVTDGAIVVKTEVDTGKVYVDNVAKGTLVKGEVRLTVVAGSHRLRIESDNKRIYEETVTVVGGDELSVAVAKPCDFDAIVKRGEELHAIGNYGAALGAFEQALKCKPDDLRAILRAYMTACNSKQMEKAKRYFKKLPTDKQNQYAGMCIRSFEASR